MRERRKKNRTEAKRKRKEIKSSECAADRACLPTTYMLALYTLYLVVVHLVRTLAGHK